MNEHIVKKRLSLPFYNHLAKSEPMRLVQMAEEHYHEQLSAISRHICENKERYKVVLLAGPSASGKTTTASKLRKQLKKDGIESVYVSLDNFFFNRDDLPFLEDGMRDFESVNALDLDCLNRFFKDLLETNHAQAPVFDFNTGCRSDQVIDLKIDDNFVVIIEGIHALNPIITGEHYAGSFCKLYISPKSEFELDGRVVLNSRNIRLIRRIVRDYHFRSSSAVNTLNMWKHVVTGEDVYIRPYRTTADFWIDSTYFYEPMIFHHDLLPILAEVPDDSPYSDRCKALGKILDLFYDLEKEVVPADSLLREFIG